VAQGEEMNTKLDGGKVLTGSQNGHKCVDCRHSMPATIYPKQWCFVVNGYKDQGDYCCRWQVRN
jgi:hypothetical protein